MHTYKNSNLKYEPYKKLHFWNFSRPLSNGQCECCKDHSCKEECIFKDHICGVVIISAFPLPRSCVGVLTRMACSAGRSERERVLMMIAVIRWSRLARLIIYCWGRGHPPTTSLGIWVNQSCAARSRAHNRMVIIRGVITCESAGNNNMLARGCVTRFNFFDLHPLFHVITNSCILKAKYFWRFIDHCTEETPSGQQMVFTGIDYKIS